MAKIKSQPEVSKTKVSLTLESTLARELRKEARSRGVESSSLVEEALKRFLAQESLPVVKSSDAKPIARSREGARALAKRLRAGGDTLGDIARVLNAAGHRPARAIAWTERSVGYLLRKS